MRYGYCVTRLSLTILRLFSLDLFLTISNNYFFHKGLTPVLLGNSLAYKYLESHNDKFSFEIFFLSLISALVSFSFNFKVKTTRLF
jgi:hypothetical protein